MPKKQDSDKTEYVWDPGEANPKQKLFFSSRKMYTAYGGAKGGGKAQPLTEPVLTPFGFRPMGSLSVGSTVCTPTGTAKVIQVHPRGVMDVYRVTFNDGASTRCTLDHLWLARRTARNSGWKVWTTGQLLDIVAEGQENSSILVPLAQRVTLTPGKYGGKIGPYTLGVLLGDGCLCGKGPVTFTTGDVEMRDLVEAEGYRLTEYAQDRNHVYALTHRPEIRQYLRENGLCCKSIEKRVPNGYKFAPENIRRAVLQGLMDTDGYADARGHCSFTSISSDLAEDVQWLVRSLGGRATITSRVPVAVYPNGTKKAGATAYTVYIQTENNSGLFRLERKRKRCEGKPFNGGISEMCRKIVSIEPCGAEECQCITVDDPEGLYLTRDFIVTHNSWAVRQKARMGAYQYPGIRILVIRQHYSELQSNIIEPMLREGIPELESYNGSTRVLTFENGSIVRFGHWNGENSELEYNGQEYDWIFIDEATQLTWRTFQFLGGCMRGANQFPKRMYITCNPGGVGHRWVKRLFIDRQFYHDPNHPESDEDPNDYVFIPATIEDNTALLNSAGGEAYKRQLMRMPENVRKAYRYGDWESLGGNYFPEFGAAHVIKPFAIPEHWKRYRAFDYGLDMFACGWFAVDEAGRSYMYREFSKSDLIVQDAAGMMKELTLPGERIETTFAPPDMWSRQKDTGRTMAEVFMENDVPIVPVSNNRVQGHLLMKEAFAMRPDGRPSLMLFDTCTETADDVRDIQSDERNPNDCAKDPHEVTHRVDCLRYYCVSRVLSAELEASGPEADDAEEEDYDEFMTGGDGTAGYLSYGGNG